ncbi:MAG TPA: beta-ketoacyl-ACP synthase III [Gemmataceae bacterium]|jgi:3-oxoacyl-[acyl-carrier-protein] synthase-3|nr:beta-ketoacyl-ACP synthase III [Gemmataceae bacterium]
MLHGPDPEGPGLPRPKCRRLTGVRVIATGSYVPDAVVSNDHLFERFGFDSDWIVKRTGILERRHALPHQATSDLCLEAINRCVDRAGINLRDIDLLLVGTFTPDYSFPSTACIIQDKLKLVCPAVDMQAACAGFMYALITGAAYVASGASDLCLIVGGDCNSRILNPDDIKTYPLFGDGAGAFLLTRGGKEQGILAYSMGADGSGGEQLIRYACGSRQPPTADLIEKGQHYMIMDGRAVFRWAVEILNDTIQDVLDAVGMTPGDVDLYVPHQANIRIINAACDTLKIPRQRVYTNLDRYGNTSAGSIPLAVDEALADGRLKDGDVTVLSGFGAGLTWGTAVMRW